MLMNENFCRCSECDNAFFEIKEVHLLEVISKDLEPQIQSTRKTYICSECGKEYTREELN